MTYFGTQITIFSESGMIFLTCEHINKVYSLSHNYRFVIDCCERSDQNV
jgi:hypothetical protein